MSTFTKRFAKWMAVSRYNRRGGGIKSTLTGILTVQLEVNQERRSTIPAARKRVWHTGWHAGALGCANCVLVVLLINVSLTIYSATNTEYKMEGGVGTLYYGSCDKSKKIGMWLH